MNGYKNKSHKLLGPEMYGVRGGQRGGGGGGGGGKERDGGGGGGEGEKPKIFKIRKTLIINKLKKNKT